MEERRKEDLELRERLVALETQMKRLMSHLESEQGTQERVADAIDRRFNASDERQVAADGRLRTLEHTIWKAAGAITVIGALVVIAVNIIMKHL